MIEDYRGHYWHRHRGTLVHPCGCPEVCLFGVEIRRDITGRWYARHQPGSHGDWRAGRLPTRSSPRYEAWQDAAAWADNLQLLTRCLC